jgi:hypothetical protein
VSLKILPLEDPVELTPAERAVLAAASTRRAG